MRLLSITLAMGLVACAGTFGPAPFTVTQPDTRFAPTTDQAFIGHNNRISSKSVVGGVHIDAGGVYIDPGVIKDRNTGAVSLRLLVTNRTDYSTNYGTVNQLGLLESLAFALPGGRTITLPISRADVLETDGIARYNSITNSASIGLRETGMAPITRQQFEDIVNAQTMAVRVRGSMRSVTYESNELAPSFVSNLRTFYQQYVR